MKSNLILSRSKAEDMNWEIVFDYIFSDVGLINQSYFVTKNVGMQKTYKRV